MIKKHFRKEIPQEVIDIMKDYVNENVYDVHIDSVAHYNVFQITVPKRNIDFLIVKLDGHWQYYSKQLSEIDLSVTGSIPKESTLLELEMSIRERFRQILEIDPYIPFSLKQLGNSMYELSYMFNEQKKLRRLYWSKKEGWIYFSKNLKIKKLSPNIKTSLNFSKNKIIELERLIINQYQGLIEKNSDRVFRIEKKRGAPIFYLKYRDGNLKIRKIRWNQDKWIFTK